MGSLVGRRGAFWVSSSAVVVLALGLASSSVALYEISREQQLATLRSQLLDRGALKLQMILHEDITLERDFSPYAVEDPDGVIFYFRTHDGEVIAAPDPAWLGQSRWLPSLERYREQRLTPVVASDVLEDGAYEAWIHMPPPRLRRRGGKGPLEPPLGQLGTAGPPNYRGAGWICMRAPSSRNLPGSWQARLQLALSWLGAFVLLGLAVWTMRASRREAELRLAIERKQRLEALGQLGATLAHEIRTPLAAVRGFAQLLLERARGEEERLRRPAEKIVRETDRLERLVESLLQYARPAPPQFRDVNLSALVLDVAERLAPLAAASEVRLLCDQGEGVRVEADPDRLIQAIDNLVKNAISFSPQGETVLLQLRVSNGEVALDVADRGPGVALEQREVIFAPFHTTRASGTGLGLAVARRIADEHGGRLEIVDREGGGACFRLTLPRGQAKV